MWVTIRVGSRRRTVARGQGILEARGGSRFVGCSRMWLGGITIRPALWRSAARTAGIEMVITTKVGNECRVCLRPVIDPNAWIHVGREVERIWVCPRHNNGNTQVEIADNRIVLWTDDGPTLLWPIDNSGEHYLSTTGGGRVKLPSTGTLYEKVDPSKPLRWSSRQNQVYREALVRCAELAGADLSGGVPSWPPVEVWAVQSVEQLRKDYDDALTQEADEE